MIVNQDENQGGTLKAPEHLPIQTSMGTESVQYCAGSVDVVRRLNETLEEIVISQCETKRGADMASGIASKTFLVR